MVQITHHTQLLNALIEKYKLKSYLEIGVQNPANNFDRINVATDCKVGIDPELTATDQIHSGTSDSFFSKYPFPKASPTFDLIFIDGLHHADQVKRDFENSLRCLSDNGFIVIHDVLPANYEGTKVPRETKQWWGTVYQLAMTLCTIDGIDFKTFAIDEGCCLVWKDTTKKGTPIDGVPDWDTYRNVGDVALRVVDEVVI